MPKNWNELTEFEQQIITFLTAASPDVETAKMLFLGYLREQQNDPYYLSAIGCCSEEEANKGGSIQRGLALAAYDELKRKEKEFLKPIFDEFSNFSELAEFASNLYRGTTAKFYAPCIWTNGGSYHDGNYYEDLNNLERLYEYPIYLMQNNKVLIPVAPQYRLKDSAECCLVDCIERAAYYHPNLHFFFPNLHQLHYIFDNQFRCKFPEQSPVINLLVIYRSEYRLKDGITAAGFLAEFSNMLYSLFDFHKERYGFLDFDHTIPKALSQPKTMNAAEMDKLTNRIVRPDLIPAYYTLKEYKSFWRFNFVIEKHFLLHNTLSNKDFQDNANAIMQKLAKDLHFDHYQITYEIIV